MDIGRSLVLLCLLVGLAACSDENPVRPASILQVTGTWDARFEGAVQGAGSLQMDSFVLELRQSGASVTGTLRFAGIDLAVPVSGEVDARTFTYTARALLAPECEAVVRAETIVDSAGVRFSGSQSQSTCEGTAIGQVMASRRE